MNSTDDNRTAFYLAIQAFRSSHDSEGWSKKTGNLLYNVFVASLLVSGTVVDQHGMTIRRVRTQRGTKETTIDMRGFLKTDDQFFYSSSEAYAAFKDCIGSHKSQKIINVVVDCARALIVEFKR